MPDGGERFSVQVHRDIAAIGAVAWDACAGAENPFLSYAFLEALEASGSATGTLNPGQRNGTEIVTPAAIKSRDRSVEPAKGHI